LYTPIRRLDYHFPLFPVQGHLLVAYLPHQIYRLSGRFPHRQQQFVLLHGLFQCFSDLVLSPEKPVRRHHAVNALVGPEVVVVVDEMAQPFLGFAQVLRLDPLPKFLHDRGPEPFRLAYRLGVVGSRHHVLDAFLAQHLLEVAFSPPGEILPALVGQHFLRFPEPFHAR
jgi:hypothetical protein